MAVTLEINHPSWPFLNEVVPESLLLLQMLLLLWLVLYVGTNSSLLELPIK